MVDFVAVLSRHFKGTAALPFDLYRAVSRRCGTATWHSRDITCGTSAQSGQIWRCDTIQNHVRRRGASSALLLLLFEINAAATYFNCAPVYPAMFAQPFFKGGNRLCPQLLGHSSKKPDHRPPLLRSQWERPHRRATEKRNELAPPHSITSSARASRVGGTTSPNVLAVCRLMTSSNLVARRTGRSAGLSPLRTRPL